MSVSLKAGSERPTVTRIVVLAVLLGLVGAPYLVHAAQLPPPLCPAEQPCRPGELSPEQVAQQAVAYTWAQMCVVSGEPDVVLLRPVLASELPSLGIPANLGLPSQIRQNVVRGDGDPPLMLVVFRGQFYHAGDFWRGERIGPPVAELVVRYLVYLFNLERGAVIQTETSALGGRFRALLNDPSLPDDPPTPWVLDPAASTVTCQLPPGYVPPPTPVPFPTRVPTPTLPEVLEGATTDEERAERVARASLRGVAATQPAALSRAEVRPTTIGWLVLFRYPAARCPESAGGLDGCRLLWVCVARDDWRVRGIGSAGELGGPQVGSCG